MKVHILFAFYAFIYFTLYTFNVLCLASDCCYVLYLAQEKKTYSDFFGISFSFATADHLPPSSFPPYP